MNIQIFGKNKCFDTKKAQRYFKERGIKFQFIELDKYGMSNGEFNNIKRAVGGLKPLIDEKSKDFHSIAYLSEELQIEESLLDNPRLFKTPIVRNGKHATIGFCQDIWAKWE